MRKQTKKLRRKLCKVTELQDCSLCDHFLYICEGDAICDKASNSEPKLILSDWKPTEDYMWCDCSTRRNS